MKKINLLIVCAIAISIVFVNCNKEKVDTVATASERTIFNINSEEANPDKWAQLPQSLVPTPLVPITNTVLCPGVTVSGSFAGGNIGNSALWDYYTFNGKAGDVITIYAPRTGNCHLDPSFSLYSGTTNDNTGVTIGNGGPNMTFLSFQDDNTPQVCAPPGSCFADPTLSSFVLPTTGAYTIGVQSFINCPGGPFTYDLTLTFNTLSNLVIDGCDTGVPDKFLVCNSRFSNAIAACAAGAANHGDFVSCVAHLTNSWKKAGLITGEQKDAIMECAAESDLP